MKPYLLLGAGFSHNWGGWLATEVFEYLLGHPGLRSNPEVRALLWQHAATGGFEGALAELQLRVKRGVAGSQDAIAGLMAALRQMFDDMNSSFRGRVFETDGLELPASRPISSFLRRFDAIFTLNQDLLLETHYRGSRDGLVDVREASTFRDWAFPGMKLADQASDESPYPPARGSWVPAEGYDIPSGFQPIYKLHGSSGWREAANSDLMILGGGKEEAISQSPVLRWYWQRFADAMNAAGARLMVIGYGFRDKHVNDVMEEGMRRGLRTYVIDPNGADVARATNTLTPGMAGYTLTEFENAWRSALMGASRRPFLETFRGDGAERRKVLRFFDD